MEIREFVNDIDIPKSSNIKDLNARILKDCFKATVVQLTYLFNLIFVTAIFPMSWKKALAVPLFKTGDKKSVSNYRPISLFPLVSKII